MAKIRVSYTKRTKILNSDMSQLATKVIDPEKMAKIEAARLRLKQAGVYNPKPKPSKKFKGNFKSTPKLDEFIKTPVKKSKRIKRAKKTPIDSIKARKELKYEVFLKTAYWKEVRKMVLTRDKKMCVICKATKSLDIHHDSYKNHGDEMNHLEDLMTLCRKCHKEHHDSQN